ncbi:MAG: hypothetical protein ACP6IS_05570 [Candidatus Asgardarchaeia archaeon]
MPEKVCPECGGIMRYNRNLKVFICQNCGLTVTPKELDEMIRQFKGEIIEKEENEKERKKKDYLKWWLSKDKK